ncbi:MarR family transcriptional regulator [Natrialbaceae archaeon A-gly3]
MQTQKQQSTEQLDPVPETLDSPQSKLVYIYLDATGGATVDDLNQILAMKKISILSILSSLSSEDLVEKNDGTYVAN